MPGHLVCFTERPGLKFGCFCSVLISHGHVRTLLTHADVAKAECKPLNKSFQSTGRPVEHLDEGFYKPSAVEASRDNMPVISDQEPAHQTLYVILSEGPRRYM